MGCDHDFGVGPAPSPCAHDFTGRAVTADWVLGPMPWDDRTACKVPTCRHCGLSQAMHDYLADRARRAAAEGVAICRHCGLSRAMHDYLAARAAVRTPFADGEQRGVHD